MREIDSRGRARVVSVAAVAGLGMAGLGLVTDRVAMAGTTLVADTLNVDVLLSCTFSSVENKTYVGSAANGTEVNNFSDAGVHEFNLFCNDNNGYIVTATPHDLVATGIRDVIAYTDNYAPSGVNGMWTAAVASNTVGVTVTPVVPVGGGMIISADSNTPAGGTTFTATYRAYVGSETPAGTYTGTIVYTLIASGTPNEGGSNSGDIDQSNNGGETGNGGDSTNGGGTDSGDTATEGTDKDDSDAGNLTPGDVTPDANSGSTPQNTQNAAPLASGSTYNTYNTTNTYSTTNYAGGSGASTPVTSGTQLATSGNTNGATSENGSNSYEKPLGVTTNTASTKEDSGVDPAPMIAAGVALAVAGVTAVALVQSKKKEEE